MLQEHGHGADLQAVAQLTVDRAEPVNPRQVDPEGIEGGTHLETDIALGLLGVDLDMGTAGVEGGKGEEAVLAVPHGVFLGTLFLLVLFGGASLLYGCVWILFHIKSTLFRAFSESRGRKAKLRQKNNGQCFWYGLIKFVFSKCSLEVRYIF